MKVFLLFILMVGITQGYADQFLLMKPIDESLEKGDLSGFKSICEEKISVNFEEPFHFNGYFYIDQFIELFASKYEEFKVNKKEWSSKQIEDKFAIQSMNLVLKNTRSDRIIYYKFIFFMVKIKEWKIYYLRGLKI